MEEQEREGVIGTSLGLSAKAQRMEQGGWAAPWGVGGGEVLTNTEVLIRQRSS